MTEFRAYLISKLLWNPNENEKWIRDDFCIGYYGKKAGPYIIQLFDAIEKICMKDFPNGEASVHYGPYPKFFPQKFFYHMKWIWDKAVEAASNETDPRYKYNTEMGRLTSLYVQYRRNLDVDFNPVVKGDKISYGPNHILKDALDKILKRCPDIDVLDEYMKGVCFLA